MNFAIDSTLFHKMLNKLEIGGNLPNIIKTMRVMSSSEWLTLHSFNNKGHINKNLQLTSYLTVKD